MRLPQLPGFVLTALLLAPGALLAQEEEVGLFSVDLGLSIWTIVVFLLLLWILGKFAWGPILGGLEARERAIQESIDDAKRMREEAQQLLEEHREKLGQARKEAQEMVSEAREAGDRLRKEMEEKARAESDRLLERARRDIALERARAVQEIREESVELALAAAEKLLRRRLDGEQDRDLVLEALRELEPSSAEA